MANLDFKTYSHKKLARLRLICSIVSICLLSAVPMIIVGIRYDILKLQPKTALPGTMIIVLIIIAISLIKWASKNIKVLKEIDITKMTMKQRYAISLLNMAKKLIIPLVFVLFALLTLDNIHYSVMTIVYVSMPIMASFILDGVVTDPIASLLMVDSSIYGEREFEERKNIL